MECQNYDKVQLTSYTVPLSGFEGPHDEINYEFVSGLCRIIRCFWWHIYGLINVKEYGTALTIRSYRFPYLSHCHINENSWLRAWQQRCPGFAQKICFASHFDVKFASYSFEQYPPPPFLQKFCGFSCEKNLCLIIGV